MATGATDIVNIDIFVLFTTTMNYEYNYNNDNDRHREMKKQAIEMYMGIYWGNVKQEM